MVLGPGSESGGGVHALNLAKIAKAYIRQAGDRLDDAKRALERGNYPYTLRLSQECVELCLKAALKTIGVEYPKIHDVSDVLLEYRDRFPAWFAYEVEFLANASRSLAAKREVSFYGGEEALLSPDDLVDRKDAEQAIEQASKTYELITRLLQLPKHNVM
ncbi:MAG: HEPN domain-containing protein [Candidatus Caldarchaeum sp.]